MDILKPENIRTQVQASTRAEVFAMVADMAVQLGYATDRKAVVGGLEAREAKGTTGMEDGFAIPHVLDDVIANAGVVVLRLNGEVKDWETFDDKPVTFVIALLAPGSAAGNEHIKLLSSISRILVHDEHRNALLAASTPQEIHDIIAARI